MHLAQINVPERRLVCSERAAMLDELATSIKAGDVLQVGCWAVGRAGGCSGRGNPQRWWWY